MEINEEAIDYVFCNVIGANNVEDAVWRLFKGNGKEYANARKQFVEEYKIKVTTNYIKLENIEKEIKERTSDLLLRERIKQLRNRKKG